MELDEHLFRDEAFDCYAWLEESVIDRSGRVPELVELVPQLSLLSQALTKSIHGTLHQLTLTGPQLQSQLDSMQRVTAPLAQQLDSVVEATGATTTLVARGGGAGPVTRRKDEEADLQHLLTLHEAKERLQSCSKALVEAARWEKNVRTCAASIDSALVPERVDSGDTKPLALADRIGEMHTSLEILKEMPGAEDRKRTMERLSSQIEAAIKPKLDEYLHSTQLPVAQVQLCCAVFKSIGRGDHVVQAYCRCRPAHIHRVWYSYSASDSGSFGAWLDTFYREVLRLIQREAEHAADIFGEVDAPHVLVSLLEHTLATVKDTFRDRLKHNFSIDDLLQAYQTSCSFVRQVAKVLRTTDAIVESADDYARIHAAAVGLDQDAAERVLAAVLAPYQFFFTNYAQLAGDALSRKLTTLVPAFSQAARNAQSAEDDDDVLGGAAVKENALEGYAHRVEDISKELWGAVEDSVRHCYDFSAGAAFPAAVRVIAQGVDQVAQRLSSSIPAIRHSIGIEAQPTSTAAAHGALIADWGRFHSALALLRACGCLESDLATVDTRLTVRMREQAQRLVDGGSSSKSDDLSPAVSHKTSPQSKRKEFRRHRSGSNVLSMATLAGDPMRISSAAVTKWLKDEPEREKALNEFVQDLLLTNGDSDVKIFSDAHASLTRYTRQVQTLVYDSVFAPIAAVLRTVHTNECWRKSPDADLGDMPTFSTLPQEYITMVADLLLSLLPQLEPFAESSSLDKAAAASRDATRVCSREWATLGQLLHLSQEQMEACERIFDVSISDEEAPDAGVVSNAAAFVDTWTSVVASGATAALLSAVVKIPRLSPLGAKQLEADIGYFQNVLTALSGGGIECNFLIVGLQTALQVSEGEYAAFVEDLSLNEARSRGAEEDEQSEQSMRIVLRLHEALLAKRRPPGHLVDSPGEPRSSAATATQLY